MARAMVPVEVTGPPVNPVPVATEVTVPVHWVIVSHASPPVQAEFAASNCPLVPTAKAAGVEAADAVMIDPFAVKSAGEITQAVLSAKVPVEVIVPPVRPVPAVIEVTGLVPEEAAVRRPCASTVKEL